MTFDWKTLFLSAEGRLGRRDFWIGALALIVLGVVAGLVPVLGPLAALALLVPWTCLMAKRLHDVGRSGKLVLVPLVPTFASSVLAFAAALAVTNPATLGFAFGVGGLALALSAVSMLVGLAFLLWVGLAVGDAAPNRFGAPVESVFVTDVLGV